MPLRLLLAGALATLPATPPQETPQTRHSEIKAQPRLPASARRTLSGRRPLASGLRLGGFEFAVQPGHPPRVATEPDGPPRLRLKHGARHVFQLPGDPEPRAVELLFEEHDGNWFYGSASSRRFDLGPLALNLVDIDLDGLYTLQEDAWSLEPGGPLQRISADLLLGSTHYSIVGLEPSGEQLEFLSTPLEGQPIQLAFLARLNGLRAGEGLPALRLNAELSTGCTKHAAYLWANREIPDLDTSEQDARLPGASRAGRSAAKHATRLPLPSLEALEFYWESAEGRWALTDPTLVEIGISESAGTLTVIDVGSRPTHLEALSRAWRDTLPVPAPGSSGQPIGAPAATGRSIRRQGPVFFLRRGTHQGELESYQFELFKVTSSSRARVSSHELPASGQWPLRLGGRAKSPLAPDARYVAVHRLVIDGEERIIEAGFRTR